MNQKEKKIVKQFIEDHKELSWFNELPFDLKKFLISEEIGKHRVNTPETRRLVETYVGVYGSNEDWEKRLLPYHPNLDFLKFDKQKFLQAKIDWLHDNVIECGKEFVCGNYEELSSKEQQELEEIINEPK